MRERHRFSIKEKVVGVMRFHGEIGVMNSTKHQWKNYWSNTHYNRDIRFEWIHSEKAACQIPVKKKKML